MAWRAAALGLAVAAASLAYLGTESARLSPLTEGSLIALGTMGVGAIGLLVAFARLGRHFRDLERLRDGLGSHRPREDGRFPGGNDEVGGLARAVSGLVRQTHKEPQRQAGRLAAVVGLAEEPLVVLDDLGRIEAMSPAAGLLLGVQAGTDIHDVIDRPDLFRAIERAREGGQIVSSVVRRTDGSELPVRVADLGLQAGVALAFPVRGAGSHPRLSGERAVVVRPLPRGAVLGEEEPLAALPFVALWVATGGAGPEEGRVVAVGTMRLAGARLFRTVSLTLLIDPREPVTAEAAARHGITDAMLADARPFAEVWPAIREALHHCVVVGIGVESALAALARECALAGLPEPGPLPSLDLGRLAAGLDPAREGWPLDSLAAAFGLSADPRAGVFAPVEITARLAAALLVALDERGVVTHGQARVFGGSQTAE